MHLSDGEEAPTLQVDYTFPVGDSEEEDFLTLMVKNEPQMKCIACGEGSLQEWLFSFQQRGVERGKEIIFCPTCFMMFLETSIRLFLKVKKGKGRCGMKVVDRDYLSNLWKKEGEDYGS